MNRVFFDLARDEAMGGVCFAYNQRAGRIHVNPVNNSGADFSVDSGELFSAVVHNGVDQGSRIVPGSGVHHHFLGFIDNQELIVLIENVQGNPLRPKLCQNGVWNGNKDPVFLLQLVAGSAGVSVDQNKPLFDQFLDTVSGLSVQMIRQVAVNSQSTFFSCAV